jgi:methylenetetrahydrofolate dehydrogenase (NADP+)/methenyltetrahydrofolate cyclohydrolase
MENATPTVCHSKTEDLSYITKNSDIVVAALNKKEFIDSNFITKGTVVVDVGVHRNSEGKTVGDVKYDDVLGKSSLITPPTGGVGPMTICMLCYNSAYSIYGEEVWSVLDQGIEKAKVLVKEK